MAKHGKRDRNKRTTNDGTENVVYSVELLARFNEMTLSLKLASQIDMTLFRLYRSIECMS